MKLNLPPYEYYKQLPKVPTSGGAILKNSKGEFLIIKNTYKDGCSIPGGMCEENETPSHAVIREVKEELGINIENPKLFAVDFDINKPFPRIMFLFDCGTIDDDTVNKITLNDGEISEYRFEEFESAVESMRQGLKIRMSNSIDALRNNYVVYLENGKKPQV